MKPLSLPSGTQVLETDESCGVTLDSVLLNDGVGPLAGPAPAVAAVEVDQTSATSYQLQVGFVREPTWLTIGASFDSDWRGGGLTDLGAAKLLNGYAASWQLDQVVDEKFIFTARWTPQRAVNVGVIFSTIALLVLSAISLIPGWRRSNRSDLIVVETLRAGNSNIVVLAVLGGFGIAAGAIPAIVAGGAALLLELRPRYHRRIAWSAPALLGVVAVTKVVHATIGDDPTRIQSLAGPAWIEVLTYTALRAGGHRGTRQHRATPVKRYPTDLM